MNPLNPLIPSTSNDPVVVSDPPVDPDPIDAGKVIWTRQLMIVGSIFVVLAVLALALGLSSMRHRNIVYSNGGVVVRNPNPIVVTESPVLGERRVIVAEQQAPAVLPTSETVLIPAQ